MSGETAGGAGVDPASTAYRVHAYAFNTLTTMLAADDRYIPLSVREAIASAVVEAIEPLIRADDAGQVRLAREDRDQLRKQVLDLAAELERLAGEHSQKAAEYDRDAAQENFHRGCRAALDNAADCIRKIAGPPS
jgi:hypothetical protein